MNRLAGLLEEPPKQETNRLAGLLDPESSFPDPDIDIQRPFSPADPQGLAPGALATAKRMPQVETHPLESMARGIAQFLTDATLVNQARKTMEGPEASKVGFIDTKYYALLRHPIEAAKIYAKMDIKEEKEIGKRAVYAGKYLRSLGGLTGNLIPFEKLPESVQKFLDYNPATWGVTTTKEELKGKSKDLSGFGGATVPATAEAVKSALEWAYIYPIAFKGAEKIISGIEKFPIVKQALQYIKKIGGIEKIKTAYPKIYEGTKSVIQAMEQGGLVGLGKGTVESIADDMPLDEALAHIAKSTRDMAVISGIFRAASDIDKRSHLKEFKQILDNRLQHELDMIAKSGRPSGNKGQDKITLSRLRSARTKGEKFIKEAVAAREAELFGVERRMYGGKQAGSPQKAADRFMREGTQSIGKEPFQQSPEHLRGPELRTQAAKSKKIAESLLKSSNPKKQAQGREIMRRLSGDTIQSGADIVEGDPALKSLDKQVRKIGGQISRNLDRVESLKQQPQSTKIKGNIQRLTKQVETLRIKQNSLDRDLSRRVAEVQNQQMQEGRLPQEARVSLTRTEAEQQRLDQLNINTTPETRPQSAEQVLGKSSSFTSSKPAGVPQQAPASGAVSPKQARMDAELAKVVSGTEAAVPSPPGGQTPAALPVSEGRGQGGLEASVERQEADATREIADATPDVASKRGGSIKFPTPQPFKTGEGVYLKNNKEYGGLIVNSIDYVKPDSEGLGAGYVITVKDKDGKIISGTPEQFEKQSAVDFRDNEASLAPTAEGVRLIDESMGSSHGQRDGRYYATDKDGNYLGRIDYAEFEDEILIKYIEVEPEHRRKGIGTKLYEGLKAEYPDSKIIPFGDIASESGQAFSKAVGITAEETPPQIEPQAAQGATRKPNAPLEHPLAQGKTHAELAEMPVKEYADTIHEPANARIQEIKARKEELRKSGKGYAQTQEWKDLTAEEKQLFQITRNSSLPQAGQAFHQEMAKPISPTPQAQAQIEPQGAEGGLTSPAESATIPPMTQGEASRDIAPQDNASGIPEPYTLTLDEWRLNYAQPPIEEAERGRAPIFDISDNTRKFKDEVERLRGVSVDNRKGKILASFDRTWTTADALEAMDEQRTANEGRDWDDHRESVEKAIKSGIKVAPEIVKQYRGWKWADKYLSSFNPPAGQETPGSKETFTPPPATVKAAQKAADKSGKPVYINKTRTGKYTVRGTKPKDGYREVTPKTELPLKSAEITPEPAGKQPEKAELPQKSGEISKAAAKLRRGEHIQHEGEEYWIEEKESVRGTGFVAKIKEGKFTVTKGDPMNGWSENRAIQEIMDRIGLGDKIAESKKPLDTPPDKVVQSEQKGQDYEINAAEKEAGRKGSSGISGLSADRDTQGGGTAGTDSAQTPAIRPGAGAAKQDVPGDESATGDRLPGTEVSPPAVEVGREPAAGRTGQGVSRNRSDAVVPEASVHDDQPARPRAPLDENLDLRKAELVRMTKGQRKAVNEQVRRILEKDSITPEDREILRQYTGQGGLTEGKEALNQHYTDYETIRRIFDVLDKSGFTYQNVLEPSVGSGNFVGMRPGKNWTTVDIDKINHEVVRKLYPKGTHYLNSYEEYKEGGHDLIISNVPFLEVRGKGRLKNRPDIKALHDFYFAHSLDLVKENGVVAFITSTGTMDKLDPTIRKEIVSKADVIGAFRLPQGHFKANAHTEVITDVIFLQKRPAGVPSRQEQINQAFVQSADDAEGLRQNRYYALFPEKILGEVSVGKDKLHGGKPIYVISPPVRLDEMGIEYKPYAQTAEQAASQTETQIPRNSKAFEVWANKNNVTYRIQDELNGAWFSENVFVTSDGVEVYAKDQEISFTDISRKAKTYKPMTDNEARKTVALEQLRRKADLYQNGDESAAADGISMIEAYRREYRVHPKKDPKLKRFFGEHDAESYYLELSSLFDKDFIPADVFRTKTRYTGSGKSTTKTSASLNERAFASEDGKGVVDVGRSSLLSEDDVPALLQSGYSLVDYDTDGSTLQNDILYYSGNIYQKIDQARTAQLKAPAIYADHIESQLNKLEEIKPAAKTLAEIRFKGTESWMLPHLSRIIRIQKKQDKNGQYFWDTRDKIYSKFLNNNALITRRSEDVGGIKIEEPITEYMERLREAEEHVEEILDSIREQVAADPKLQSKIEHDYNSKFRNYVRPDYQKAAYLIQDVLDEIDKTRIHLRKNQVEWVVQAVYEGKGINSHDVGGGKTFASIALARVLKKRGIANKPIFVVPSKTIKKWERDIKTLFPDAKIFNLGKLDAAKRTEKLFELANTNADYVLISMEGFNHIKLPADIEIQYVNAVVSEHIDDIEASGRQKGLIEEKIDTYRSVLMGEDRDPRLTFDKLGIDMIVADEAHAYKNIGIRNSLNKFGLGASFGINTGRRATGETVKNDKGEDVPEYTDKASLQSDRSYSFRFKANYIAHHNHNNNVYLLTATPTPNKPMEIYTMLRHLQPDLFHEYGIYSDQDFANAFFKLGSVENPGTGKAKSILSAIVNAQELRGILNRFVDKIPMEQMPWIKIPEENAIEHFLELSDGYADVQQDLIERRKNLEPRPQAGDDNVISIYTGARAASVDPRLYGGTHAGMSVDTRSYDPEDDKLQFAIEQVSKVHKDSKNAGQLIFLDAAGHTQVERGQLAEDLHKEIKRELVASGFKKGEIAIINGKVVTNIRTGTDTASGDKEAKKQEIADAYNEGKIKVIIGTTASMGEGMDLQIKTTDIWHMDIPFTPGAYRQRNGRGIRFGNENDTVNIHYLFMKGTFDALSFQIVSNKKGWNEAIWEKDVADEISTAEEMAEGAIPKPEQILIAMETDPQKKQLLILKFEYKRMMDEQSSYYQLRRGTRGRVQRTQVLIKEREKLLESQEKKAKTLAPKDSITDAKQRQEVFEKQKANLEHSIQISKRKLLELQKDVAKLENREHELSTSEDQLIAKIKQFRQDNMDENGNIVVGDITEKDVMPKAKVDTTPDSEKYFRYYDNEYVAMPGAKPIDFEGLLDGFDEFDFFIAKDPDDAKKWTIYEARTGLGIGGGNTQTDAKNRAVNRLEKVGAEKIKTTIEETVEHNGLSPRYRDPDDGFASDPSVETDPQGEGGFVRIRGNEDKGKIKKPWLDDKKVKSPNQDIEGFFGRTKRPPYSKKASKLINLIKAGIRERFVTMTPHIANTPDTAIYRDMIRTLPEEVRQAGEKAVRDIISLLDNDGTVQALDSVGLDLLRRKVFVQDILQEAEIDRSVSGGFEKEELEAENTRLDALIDKVPSVKRAYENRQKLWDTISQDLLERGVLDEETAANRHYVRHFVLDLAEKNGPTGFKRKRLSEPYRAYKKHRKGSTKDISTDYLEVEVRALAQIYKDNAVEDVANNIGDLADKRKQYTSRAKTANFEQLVGGPDNVARIKKLRSMIRESQEGPDKNDSDEKLRRKQWIEELTELDPTYPYRKRIAMHMSKFKKGSDLGDIEDDGALFRELAKVAKDEPQSDRGMAARGVFKAMAERDKMIRDALGGQFLTPERLAEKDGYVEWHYKRPNLFYRAHTLTESQIAAMVESSAEEVGGMLHIPKDKMREALVLGRRKGMIVPDWLAKQLDDLPVNRRSNYVVRSFTKPFVQFWKRWILRVNPLRYNVRNQIGDTERLNAAGQNGATKDIPRAVKFLVTKEGEYYDLMKKYGDIGSTLWHEMNDVSTIKEFERFKDYSKKKNFRQATAKAFMLPLKTVSKIGSIEQNLTQMREDILRAAVFINNYEKLKAGKPVRHWAGKLADIEEIAKTDKARAASKISRETLGDYGNFTPFEEDYLRQGILPFYSWMKINTVFWPRVIINASKEGTGGKSFRIAAGKVGMNLSMWLVRILGVYAAAHLWNHRNEEAKKKEESLPFWLRAMPHFNAGDYTLWGQTALSDFAEWADYEGLASVQWRYDAGFLTKEQAVMEASKVIAQAPVNKLYQSLNPYLKAPVTAITGMKTYPSVFEPYFAASPASRKSMEMAVLDILGTDAKKFYQTAAGDRKFEDTLYAYFAGWWGRPIDPDILADEILKTKEWSSLKRDSKTTGRAAGQAKSGKEEEWQESKIREDAVGPEAMREAKRRASRGG